MKIKRLLAIFIIIDILLLVPFFASFFTDEVNWSFSDYVIAAILLITAGIMVEVISRKVKSFNLRLLAIIVMIAIFLLIWGELAVGIFNTPFAGS